MKKRLHDKKAGIAILIVLFIISLADVILRSITFGNMVATSANHGEVFMTAVFSLLLIFFAIKGKDRIFHILCGVLLGFFVLEQFMGLPYIVSSLFTVWDLFASIVPMIALVSRLLLDYRELTVAEVLRTDAYQVGIPLTEVAAKHEHITHSFQCLYLVTAQF